jgi:hypothetical protein
LYMTSSDGSSVDFDCSWFGRLNVCSNGGQGSDFFNVWNRNVTGIEDPIFTNANGVSVVDACCACGGGQTASTVRDVLKSWRLAIYGHDGTSAPATPTSGQEVVVAATTGASSPTTTTTATSATNGAPTAGTTVPVASPPLDAPRGTSGAAMSGFPWTVTLALALVFIGHTSLIKM